MSQTVFAGIAALRGALRNDKQTNTSDSSKLSVTFGWFFHSNLSHAT